MMNNTTSTTGERLYSVREVAQRMGCARITVWRAIRAGRIPAVRIGHDWRIPASALEPTIQSGGAA